MLFGEPVVCLCCKLCCRVSNLAIWESGIKKGTGLTGSVNKIGNNRVTFHRLSFKHRLKLKLLFARHFCCSLIMLPLFYSHFHTSIGLPCMMENFKIFIIFSFFEQQPGKAEKG